MRCLSHWVLALALGWPGAILAAPDSGVSDTGPEGGLSDGGASDGGARDGEAGRAIARDAGAGDGGDTPDVDGSVSPTLVDLAAQIESERDRQTALQAELAKERATLEQITSRAAARASAREAYGAERAEFSARGPPTAPEVVDKPLLEQVAADAAARRETEMALAGQRDAHEARLASMLSIEEARTARRTAEVRSEALEEALRTSPPGPGRAALELRAESARLAVEVTRTREQRVGVEQAELRDALALLTRRIALAAQRSRWQKRRLELHQAAYERALAAARADTAEALESARAALAEAVTPTARYFAESRVQLITSRLGRANAAAARVTLDRRLGFQKKVLEAEKAEFSGLESLVSRDASGERTAEQLKDAFQRLDRRRAELSRLRKRDELQEVDNLRGRRLDVATALFTLDTEWEPTRALLDPTRHEAAAEQRERMREALTAEADMLAEALGVGEKLLVVVGEREEVLARLDRLIRGRIFWVQDAPALGTSTFEAAMRESRTLIRWLTTTRTWTPDARGAIWPMPWIEAVGGVLTLLMFGLWFRLGRWRRRFDRGEVEGEVWQSALATLLRVAIVPAWLWLASGLVELTALPAGIRPRLGHGLALLATLAALASVERLLFQRRGGFAKALHLPNDTRLTLRRSIRAVLLGAFLCMVPRGVLAIAEPTAPALERLLYSAFELLVLLTLVGMLRPGAPVGRDLLAYIGRPAVTRLAGPVWLGLSIAGLVVVGMDIAGYRYGAGWLAQNSLASMAVLGGLLLVWRPLARQVVEPLGELLSDESPPERGQARARRLIGGILTIVGILSLAAVWDINRQALAFLDATVLYHMGSEPVTGADLAGAMLAVLITGWLVRTLPRLLAATMFNYVDVDEALQFAVVTIARYAMLALGVVVALNALHIDLSKLGWLVAAVGVGLGFGLQEIVANFISGIILLMERPIRIGDWIGIGSIEGRVQHISIRATTLLTLDRQEIIVPNKDFITREVINWTLTDGLVRLTVTIGVAYGSEVEQIRGLLLDVAHAEARVCDDPPPTAILFDHGDSALTFQLMVHHRDPAQSTPLRGALNAAINRRLAEAGVEIPFPQQDVHIRTGLEALTAKRLSEDDAQR